MDRRLSRMTRSIPPISEVMALDVAAFVVPAVAFLEISIVGRLLVSEVLLLATTVWLWKLPRRRNFPLWFAVAGIGWLISQAATDLIVGSDLHDLARGWAGIVFTLTNFTGIFLLISNSRRVRLFAVGLAFSGLAGSVFAPHPFAAADPWQWAFALPIGFLLAATVSGPWGVRWPWTVVALLASFAVLNAVLGYRSLAGVSAIVAGYVAVSRIGERCKVNGPRRALVGLTIVLVLAVGLVTGYSVAAARGWLGAGAQTSYERQGGALGVILGGRPEALVSTQAIIDSPIVGHGSWAEDPYYAQLLARRQVQLGYEVTSEYVGTDLIPAHSYLLGAWVWAGVLGGVFWLAVGAVPVWMLANLYVKRIALAPLLVFLAALLLWDILFSPYGLGARIGAPFALVACLLGLDLIKQASGVGGGLGPQ